jgi:quinohemoprotein ethanol dehydrogenase
MTHPTSRTHAGERYRFWIRGAALVAAVAVPLTAAVQSSTIPSRPAPARTTFQPNPVAAPTGQRDADALNAAQAGAAQPAARSSSGAGWSTVMGDLANRYSTLDQINVQTVSRLGAAWMSERLPAPANTRSMTVVKDGMIFLTAGPNVLKLDARTGQIVWRFSTAAGSAARGDAARGDAARGEAGRGGQAGRGDAGRGDAGRGAGRGGTAPAPRMGTPDREGVALGDGLVFVGLSDSRAIALREDTGELVWNQYVGEDARDKGQGISGAPVYAGGIVSVGLSGDNGWRGQVVGLDGKTGREVWRWFAVPAPGEPGSDTWPKTAQWQFGGGALWLAGIADEEAGLVYYVTGNGVPQLSGEHREGNNLYICSMVALDMKTGKLKWHYQTIRHDIWEADMSISPVLFETQVSGRTVKAVGAIRPDGYVFTFDRITGKPLMAIEERRVPQDKFQKTAATQPFPAGAEGVLPDCAWWRTQKIPKGFEVGCYYQAVSTTKPNVLMPYYGMRVAPMSYSQQTGYFYAVGERSLRWLRRAEDGYFFSTGFSNRVPGIDRFTTGVMAAIDGKTHKIVWRREFPLGAGRPSGVLTTAGGLMFHATPDGSFNAHDAKTGDVVWQFRTGAPAGGPASAFTLNGEQFILLVTNNNVWAFSLGGTLPQQAPLPPRREPELFVGPIVETLQLETSALQRDNAFTGARFMTDEYQFSPYRAKVAVGATVTWRNNGTMVHSAVAEDGSWSTGPIDPAGVAAVTFAKPGTYVYTCKEHPWAYAQIIVE